MNFSVFTLSGFRLLFSFLCLSLPGVLEASGTWTALAHTPPTGVNNALLMSDGTVICGDGGQNWYRLTPNPLGSYVNGSWSQIDSTAYTRLFYASQMLTNGNVFVAGGEYGTGRNQAELYDSVNNSWSPIANPNNKAFSDCESKILPNGNVLVAPVGDFGGCVIYNVATNGFQSAGSALNQNEAAWVRLPNDNVVTIDAFGQQSEHYVPSLNQWYPDGNLPVVMYGYGGELGAGFVLPNGKAFFIGATPNTAIYTPGATLTSAGSWVAGPTMMDGVNGLGAVDAPAAMMANGNILCAVGPTNGFNGPTTFLEYDYVANSFTQVGAPGGGLTYNNAPFGSSMLDLPDGSVLFIGGQGTTSLYIYKPDGTPLAAGQPVISSITENANGSYHLTGTGLNGITGGAAYGDDWQMETSYPLVRMTNNSSGNVYYARTYNWSSTAILNPNPVTTEFSLPANLPAGTYSLVVSANGNPSLPITFNYAPPAAPTGVTATAGNARASLNWNSVSGATAYNVLRATTSGGPYYVPVATVTGTSYTNTGMVNGMTYFYVVTAVGSGGPSAYSSGVSATPVGPPPTPAGLSAGTDSPTMVTLSWNASFGATSYNLKRATTSGGPYATVASPAGTSYSDLTVTGGTTYYYVVSAVNPNGESTNTSQVSVTPLPPPWVTVDVGSVGLAGSAAYSGSTFTLKGSGDDIWNAADAFRYAYQAVSGDCSITARVTSQSNSDVWAKAGVMIRETLDAGSTHALMAITPGNGFNFFYRPTTEASSSSASGGSLNTSPNNWMRVVRSGSTFTAYKSANGTTWTQVGSSQTITMASTIYLGLAVCAHNNNALSTATFDNVTVSGSAPAIPAAPTGLSGTADSSQVNLTWNPSAGATIYNVKRATTSGGPYTPVGAPLAQTKTNFSDTGLAGGTNYYYVVSAVNATSESANSSEFSITTLPSPWATSDIGSVATNGSASYSGTIFTVNGSGDDIWNSADAFRYAYRTASGNCSITARVTSQSNTDPWAKAGVMIRGSLSDEDAHALMAITPGNGFNFFHRNTEGVSSASASGGSLNSAPNNWVRVVRNGSTFTAYKSANGTSWTQVGTPQTVSMGPTAYIGLAVCSHNDGTLSTVTFDNVTVIAGPDAPTGLLAVGRNGQASLSWNASAGATNYNVKRTTTSGGTYTTVVSSTNTGYVNTGLANGTTYYYVITAVNGSGESGNSPEASATPFLPPPTMPTSLVATAGNRRVDLSWNVNSGAASYNVKRSLTNGGTYSIIASPATPGYADAGLTNNTTYYYVVSAVNPSGESTNSLPANATPVAPAPAMLMVGSQISGQFSFSFLGQINQSYIVETSSNLTDWVPWLTNVPATNGPVIFIDTNPTNLSRFYRVTLP
ncbi:MAG TPA: hypothetical protein VNN22_21110 [Verrucomicrobiae bacterium]|nr:hypothetical protein [Verrucomicrobiae bacterium]